MPFIFMMHTMYHVDPTGPIHSPRIRMMHECIMTWVDSPGLQVKLRQVHNVVGKSGQGYNQESSSSEKSALLE